MKNRNQTFSLLILIALAIGASLGNIVVADKTDSPIALKPFFRLPAMQEVFVKNIVLNDVQIKALIESTEYDYVVEVGVWLNQETTEAELSAFIKNGQYNPKRISDYVGVIHIGYNKAYFFTIDTDNNCVRNLAEIQTKNRAIPELSLQDKAMATTIAFNDPTLNQLLLNKNYEIIPTQDFSMWHSSTLARLGVVIEIQFEESFQLDSFLPTMEYDEEKYDFPHYVRKMEFHSAEVLRLIVFISLDENAIVNIIPIEFKRA